MAGPRPGNCVLRRTILLWARPAFKLVAHIEYTPNWLEGKFRCGLNVRRSTRDFEDALFLALMRIQTIYVALLVNSVSTLNKAPRKFTRSVLFDCIALKHLIKSLCRTESRPNSCLQMHNELVRNVAAGLCPSTATGLGPPFDSVTQLHIRPERPCSISRKPLNSPHLRPICRGMSSERYIREVFSQGGTFGVLGLGMPKPTKCVCGFISLVPDQANIAVNTLK